jgi:prepilin-type processing-associated H-X9-DG protein
MCNRKLRRAFTRRDLLVALACIAFLLANVAAVGPRGRRHAKEMLCLSNLYKWGSVFEAFAADNDGYFMRGWFDGSGLTPRDMWPEALRPYYGNNHNLRCCPEAVVPGTEIGGGQYGGNGTFSAWGVFDGECGETASSWGVVTACDYGSYGMNGWACNTPPSFSAWGRPNPRTWWRGPNAAGANNIPLFLGSQWLDGWPDEYDDPPDYDGQAAWSAGTQIGRFCINRHEGYVNIAFLDFSARKVGLKELWTLKWHRDYDVNGPWTIAGGVQPGDWPEWMQEFEDY